MAEMIIDPPVSAFSPPAQIEAWLAELRRMEPLPEVLREIEAAQQWLELSRAHADRDR